MAAGKLDRRLFDVTELDAQGYHDAGRRDLPLIVAYSAEPRARTARTRIQASGTRPVRALETLGAEAVSVPKPQAGKLWSALRGTADVTTWTASLSPGVRKVSLDGRRRVSLDVSVPLIKAPEAWRAGYTGRGVKTAILDTGYDPAHPDLKARVRVARNFTAGPDAVDHLGHGTHVASIVAGSGAASAGKYKGVAPDADLLVGKVCDDDGFCTESDLLEGMNWAATTGAKVVNMSLGGLDTPGLDPVEEAVNTLTAKHRTLFVIAAGNTGPLFGVSSPASADAALAVAATTKQDAVADFSSTGPRVGDFGVKPDLAAPGVDIVAARAAGTLEEFAVGEHYAKLSGTSMATPHVAGAAAILAQRRPDWGPEQLKSALMGSSVGLAGAGVYQQGAGRVDVAAAIAANVVATPVNVNFGGLVMPSEGGKPVRKTLTYRNTGTAPVVLKLALTVTGPDGKPAPAGAFSLGGDRITVPAGGSAEAAVTAAVPDGPKTLYGGWLTATAADGSVIRTPLGGTRLPPMAHQTFVLTDRTARRRQAGLVLALVDRATGETAALFTETGRTEPDCRRAATAGGRSSRVASGAGPRMSRDLLGEAGPAAATAVGDGFDARRGQPVTGRWTSPAAALAGTGGTVELINIGRGWCAGMFFGGATGRPVTATYVVPSSRRGAGIARNVQPTMARPDGKGAFARSPYVYNLVFGFTAAIPRPVWRVATRDLAVVPARYAAPAPGDSGVPFATGMPAVLDPNGGIASSNWGIPVDYPHRRVEFNTAVGLKWDYLLFSGDFERPLLQWAFDAELRPGRVFPMIWNNAVFGPGFGTGAFRGAGEGDVDELGAFLPLFSDASPTHTGLDISATGSATLYVNGKELARRPVDSASWTVPKERADYRLVAEAARDPKALPRLTSKVRVEWRFSSARPGGDGFAELGLPVARIAPPLDDLNRAPSGRAFAFPVYVQRDGKEGSAGVRSLAVEASYDDGATWKEARVVRTGKVWVALVHHPAGAGGDRFVSLRAKVTDTSGTTAEETMIRAYRLK